MNILFATLAACKNPADETGATDSSPSDPNPLVVTPDGNGTATEGNNQTLIAAQNGGGVYVVGQSYYPSQSAHIQLVGSTGTAETATTLPYSNLYAFGMMGTQMDDGSILLPYQTLGNSYHGVMTLNDDGAFRADRNFSGWGLTGTAAVREWNGDAVAVFGNGDYTAFPVAFENDSSLAVFNPYSGALYDLYTLNGVINATALEISGDTAIVASAGAYLNGADNAGVTKVDLAANNTQELITSQSASFSGLGLNANLDYEDGYTLLTGYNNDTPIAVNHGGETLAVELPDGCGDSGYILGAQFVKRDGAFLQFLFNSHDWETQETALYNVSGDFNAGTWDCELVDTHPATSAAAVVRYSAGKFATAGDATVYFYSAE